MMIGYHCCYDLTYLKIIPFNFYNHPFWLGFRTLIVTLFITIMGISLYLATANGIAYNRFLKRLMLILGSAALITIVTLILFRERYIFFGILHFITLASVLGLLFRRFFWINLIIGFSIFLIHLTVKHPGFDHPFLQWIGLMTHKPATEDYVPLIPWFGLVLIGIAIGKHFHQPGWFRKPSPTIWELRLAFLGQHSLLIYLLHQPLLLGGILIIKQLSEKLLTFG
jgi:uncharacterized membrane protein